MQSVTFLQDLAVVMIVAGVVAVFFHYFKQPVVLGYIIAGVIIGPHTPPFPLVSDEASIETLAQLGVIFLMFSLGLDFSLRKLREVGATALIAAGLEIVFMVFIGYQTGRFFGWSTMDSLFLGAILSISSTTIIIKALAELGKTKEKFAELIFGILIVEDILAIVMIALLSTIALTGTLQLWEVVATVGQLGIFLVALLLIGLISVPRLLGYVAKFKSDEMLLITVLALCFGVSLLVVKLEYSVALGAFMIGAIIAESREIKKIERLVEPIRDMFSAVFFVAIGMLIDPLMLVEYALPIAVITVAVVVGKVLTCSFGTFIAGHDTRTSMQVGMGLAQIGEFSFIIASLGLTLNVTSDFLYPIAVTVSAITTLLTPYLIKSSDRVVNWFDRVAPKSLVGYLKLYSGWVESRGVGQRNQATRLIRKWAWQMGLNVVLITGVFIVAAYIAQRTSGLGFQLPEWVGGQKSFLWFSSVLVTLPFFIATFRKLQAVSILVADVSVTRAAAGENAPAIRAVIANTILVVGVAALCLWVLLIGTALLPPWPILFVLLSIIAVVTALLWRFFIQIHRTARFALNEILLQSPPPQSHEPREPMPVLLREVELEAVTLAGGSPAAGKLIRELQLRTKTGASAVAIERGGVRIINPGADEELKVGDQLLLLGHRNQLDAARVYLAGH